MGKTKKINLILNIAKGVNSNEKYHRSFDIREGKLILKYESDKWEYGNVECPSFIMFPDEIPVDVFISEVENHEFKPSIAFMERAGLQFTDHFKQKYITSTVDDTTFLYMCVVDKRGKQTFPSHEEDVDI